MMLDFHSEIPAQVVLSGVMGPLSQHAPLQLIAVLAAAADGQITAFDSPTLRSTVRAYVIRARTRGVPLEEIITTLDGLVGEIAPDCEEDKTGAMLRDTVIRLAQRYYSKKKQQPDLSAAI